MRPAFAFGLAVVAAGYLACTIGTNSEPPPVPARLANACADLTAICTAIGRDCLARSAFCGVLGPELEPMFSAEFTCKANCSGDVVCLKGCKSDRVGAIANLFASRDLNLDGVVGDGLSACVDLTETCSTTGAGCSSTEFFCTSARPAPTDPCAVQLAACRAACGHDRACKRACREAYQTCEAGGGGGSGSGTPDAGTPDAPTPTPDAPPPPPPDAPPPPPPPPPTLTYTTNITPVTTAYCNGCHSGNFPPQGYHTDTYLGLFGNGSDATPNIIAFDANSKFVVKIQGNHQNVLALFPGFDQTAFDWVVRDGAPQ
jgi:hypothetical protein